MFEACGDPFGRCRRGPALNTYTHRILNSYIKLQENIFQSRFAIARQPGMYRQADLEGDH